ncbi:MAG: hypothetical protein FGM15_12105 [Chthoniobacterales bacterium]|nr:hypothetical protein [Chthoniobacterales bacterium]
MHKNKAARIEAGKNGVEAVLALSPEIVAKADNLAARLQVSREHVLATYFSATLESAPDGLEDYCLAAWTFPTKAKAQAFIEREGMNPRQYVPEQWESGGWGITNKAEYVVTYPRAA